MSRVVIVGVGALGSHVTLFLRNVDADLVVIDHDRVERKNTLSQVYGITTVGKKKTEALAQQANFLYRMNIKSVPHRLTSDNAQELLAGSALVIDALDDGPSRRLVQATASSLSIPCVHGALGAAGSLGRVVWDDRFVADDRTGDEPTCANGEEMPFIGIVAGYLAQAARIFLTTRRRVGFHVTPEGGTIVI